VTPDPITAAAAPGRLDQAVALAAGISRSQAQAWLEAGAVRVDGAPAAKASLKLRGGETLLIAPPPVAPSTVSPEDVPLTVLFEDEHLIAVDKPAGMTTHPAPGVSTGTLVNALLGRVPLALEGQDFGEEGYRPGIVHRLDRDTSGVIVVAKTVAAHARLAAAFKGREARKAYLAVTVGSPPPSVRVDAPVGRHPVVKTRMAVAGTASRDAVTDLRVLDVAPGHALVLAEPRTGRTHQIRVHLAHLKAPILGDEVYGRPSALVARQALHAWRLEVPHPVTHEPLRLEASPPEDLVSAWLAAGGVWHDPASLVRVSR
jgi:23S rRNA pseudouridine1911/1915/1917 synthase